MKNPFVIGLVLTIAYFAVIAVTIYHQAQSVPPQSLWDFLSANWNPLHSATDNSYGTIIERNNLNSAGDFLSGLVAPVAFLWLIVTAFVQMQELAETRKEIADQRKAMQEQVEEARANKVFVEEQTKIMKQQAELAATSYAKDRKLQLFDRRMAVYEEIKTFTEKTFEVLTTVQSKNDFIHLYNKALFLFSDDEGILSWLLNLDKVVTKVINEDDVAEVRMEWEALTNPDVFHMAFFRYLTIQE
ncbi:hypothetical protein A6U96_13925 [Agrobacterium tumefaciens]|nr:hypothetical protein A6U96_13925 [Agrobacterium tumefaciens]